MKVRALKNIPLSRQPSANSPEKTRSIPREKREHQSPGALRVEEGRLLRHHLARAGDDFELLDVRRLERERRTTDDPPAIADRLLAFRRDEFLARCGAGRRAPRAPPQHLRQPARTPSWRAQVC